MILRSALLKNCGAGVEDPENEGNTVEVLRECASVVRTLGTKNVSLVDGASWGTWGSVASVLFERCLKCLRFFLAT